MQWHTPIGYKVINGKIEVYEKHRKLVEQIFRDYDSGISAWRIAKNLKTMDVKNAQDRAGWSHATIGGILENYNYLGTEDYPQIIERELFDRVQKRREQVRIEGGRGKHRPEKRERLLFSGVLICAECGSVYSHIQPRSRNRKNEMSKWKCKNYVYRNRVSCQGGFISDRQVEEVCIHAINSLIQNPDLTEKYQEKPQQISPAYRKLEARLENIRKVTLEEGADTDMDTGQPCTREIGTEELTALIFERAEERYKTLEVRDEDIRSEEMQEALAGRKKITEFDEELYRKLIRQILVYKDNTVKVIFHNNNSMKIGYGEDIREGGQYAGYSSPKESINDSGKTPV